MGVCCSTGKKSPNAEKYKEIRDEKVGLVGNEQNNQQGEPKKKEDAAPDPSNKDEVQIKNTNNMNSISQPQAAISRNERMVSGRENNNGQNIMIDKNQVNKNAENGLIPNLAPIRDANMRNNPSETLMNSIQIQKTNTIKQNEKNKVKLENSSDSLKLDNFDGNQMMDNIKSPSLSNNDDFQGINMSRISMDKFDESGQLDEGKLEQSELQELFLMPKQKEKQEGQENGKIRYPVNNLIQSSSKSDLQVPNTSYKYKYLTPCLRVLREDQTQYNRYIELMNLPYVKIKEEEANLLDNGFDSDTRSIIKNQLIREARSKINGFDMVLWDPLLHTSDDYFIHQGENYKDNDFQFDRKSLESKNLRTIRIRDQPNATIFHEETIAEGMIFSDWNLTPVSSALACLIHFDSKLKTRLVKNLIYPHRVTIK